MPSEEGLFATLRNAGVAPGDSEELRLQKTLLIFATGLISFTSMLWLFIYAQLGPQFSSTIPFLFQFLLIGNLAIYLKTLNFDDFSFLHHQKHCREADRYRFINDKHSVESKSISWLRLLVHAL